MSKQPNPKRLAPTKSSTSKQSKVIPQVSLEVLMAEINKLEKPDEIDKQASQLREKLVNEWNKGGNRNMKQIEVYLEAAKVLLTKFTYLPLSHNVKATEKDLMITRDILEIGARFSVAKANSEGLKEFERYISQLKHYYFDLRKFFQKESPSMYEILGMNLLNLLSQNRTTDFHTELELFIYPNVDEVMENPYIKKAIEIEKYLMEGIYNQIYVLQQAKQQELNNAGLTSPGFKYFIDRLENTLRDHAGGIANVMGSAYDKLPMQSAMQILNLTDSTKMANIIKNHQWEVKESYIYFNVNKDHKDAIPAEEILKNALRYSEELDTIV